MEEGAQKMQRYEALTNRISQQVDTVIEAATEKALQREEASYLEEVEKNTPRIPHFGMKEILPSKW